jgi:Dolichyl-phosphate-mannose-protein mannosyltransferase
VPAARRHATVLVLALLVAVSALVRFAAARRFEIPWISPDEEIYVLLGRSFWANGSFSILGAPVPYYSFLYPVLAGAPLALFGVEHGLDVLQLVQAVVMSSTAVPVFLWGRTMMRARWALVAAGLTLLLPALAYSGLAMSETLFVPLSLWALWALARALERPSAGRQAVFGLAVAVALATRLQAIALVPVFVVSAVLLACFERRRAALRPFMPVIAALAALMVVWIALNLVGGGSWRALLGAYATVGERGYEFGRSLSFLEWHAADLFLLTVGFPLLAFIALLVPAIAGREPDRRVRAFLAAGLAYTVLLTAEVALFASRFVGHLAERQLVSVAPPLFLALMLWIERGAPRPQPWISVAAGVVAAPVLFLPVRVLSNDLTAHNAFMTIPLARLQEHSSASTSQTAYAVGAAVIVALFVLLPARAAPLFAAVVALGLLGASITATRDVERLARLERASVFSAADPSWVDEAARRPVTLFYTGERTWPDVWQQLFWNERITRVLSQPTLQVPGPLPQTAVAPDGAGFLRNGSQRVDAGLILAAPGVVFRGEPVARLPASFDQTGLVLWRVDRPAQVSLWRTGVKPNGDLLGGARVTVYGCDPGQLELTLLGKEGKPLRISRDGLLVRELTVPSGGVAHIAVPAPSDANGTRPCVYDLASMGLMGSTRIDFVRD